MKKLILILQAMALCAIAFSQQQNYNKQWVQGEGGISFKTTFTPVGPVNQFWDSIPPARCFSSGHSNICNAAGDLILATNGAGIYNANEVHIDGGDTIVSQYLLPWDCSKGLQNSIILPLPDSIYYVFNTTYTDAQAYQNQFTDELPDLVQYSVVDMKLNNYAGKVTKKRRVAMDSILLAASNMTAVRHANGRDWWMVKQGAKNSVNGGNSKFYKFLVMKDTVLGPYTQVLPNTADGVVFGSWSGQACFSNDGTKFATVDWMQYLLTLDFDRCSGQFSNPKRYITPADSVYPGSPGGVCFSPNDSML